jgi:serine/threonine protein kinase/TolB-like protein
MGEVYLAEDLTLDRRVALKVLSPALAQDPARLERFQREAKAVAALNHPHIVTIYSVQEADGIRFIAMELVEGDSLSLLVRPGGLPVQRVCEIGIALADALAAAHEKGIVHRDLKPANVMITPEGRVKVLDFGLAKLATGGLFGTDSETNVGTRAATLTTEGAVVGTVPYMSPEQLQGAPVDHRTDLFSLGVLLYELATGERPFVGGNAAALTSSILRDTPPPLVEVREDVPGELARIVAHCLRKDVRDRYQTARDVYNNLRELYRDLESGPRGLHASSSSQVRARPDASGTASGVQPGAAAGSSSGVRRRGAVPGSGVSSAGVGAPEAVSESTVRMAAAGERPWWRLSLLAAMVVVLAAVLWIGTRSMSRSAPETTPVSGGPRSVAVMPFVDLSPQRDQEYFTIGLTEELVNSLARLPDLRVAAYKLNQTEGTRIDVRTIGGQMHVGTMLEGSVTKAGTRVRIRVKLTKLPDGYTLWSESYDRTLDDIFAVQDDIARSVAAALQVTLLARNRATGPGNPEAYNLVLQAQYLRSKGGRDAYVRALELLQRAGTVDPGNARVFAEMSRLYFARASDGGSDADYGESWKAATHAVELDPLLADAHQALGWFSMSKNWDWTAADGSFKRALALEPRNVRALRSAAALAGAVGRFDEAITLGERATELEPTNAQIYYNLCIHQRKGGQLDAALLSGRKALELDPLLPQVRFQIGAIHLIKGDIADAVREFQQETDETSRARGFAMAYYSAGRSSESDRHLRELVAEHQDDAAREIAQVYAWRDEKDKAFEWLDRAYAQRDIGLAELKGEQLFRNLFRDSRWAAFLKEKLKMPQDDPSGRR